MNPLNETFAVSRRVLSERRDTLQDVFGGHWILGPYGPRMGRDGTWGSAYVSIEGRYRRIGRWWILSLNLDWNIANANNIELEANIGYTNRGYHEIYKEIVTPPINEAPDKAIEMLARLGPRFMEHVAGDE